MASKCCAKECNKQAAYRCKKCKTSVYCSTSCQKLDWASRHGTECTRVGSSPDAELDIVKSDILDVYFDDKGYILEPHKLGIPADRKKPVSYNTAVLTAAEILLRQVRDTAADPSQVDEALDELNITRLVNGRIVHQFGRDKPVYAVTDDNGRTAVVKFIDTVTDHRFRDELRITRAISSLKGVSSVKLLDSTAAVDGEWSKRYPAARANWDMLVMKQYEYSLDNWMRSRGFKTTTVVAPPEQHSLNEYMRYLAGAHMMCELLMVLSQVDEFTHTDLHMGNILMDVATDYEYHRYHLKDGIVLTVPVAPFEGRRFVLFDYGLARLKYTSRKTKVPKQVALGNLSRTAVGESKVWSMVMQAPIEEFWPGIRGKSDFDAAVWMARYAISAAQNYKPADPGESSRVLDIRFS